MERAGRRRARSRSKPVGKVSRALRCGVSKAAASTRRLHRGPSVQQGARRCALRGGGAAGGEVGTDLLDGAAKMPSGGRRSRLWASCRGRKSGDSRVGSSGRSTALRHRSRHREPGKRNGRSRISSKPQAGSTPTGARCREAAPVTEREALKQAAEAFIAGISHWPKGNAEALANAWDKAEAGQPLDAAHEKALRLLCVRSEILEDLPTPAEDHELRREYQMRRLVERMGRGHDGTDDSVESLSLEWIRGNSASQEIYQSLFTRFCGSLRSSRTGASRRVSGR